LLFILGEMTDNSAPPIFVVDDEEVIATTLVAILRHSGREAISFTDPFAALSAIRAGAAPQVLITDVMMPGMNGIELAIKLTELCPECRVLLFSGHASIVNLLEDVRKQDRDFAILAKPVHPTELLKRIEELLTA
jgi:DNA-binding NtrC family response regulator